MQYCQHFYLIRAIWKFYEHKAIYPLCHFYHWDASDQHCNLQLYRNCQADLRTAEEGALHEGAVKASGKILSGCDCPSGGIPFSVAWYEKIHVGNGNSGLWKPPGGSSSAACFLKEKLWKSGSYDSHRQSNCRWHPELRNEKSSKCWYSDWFWPMDWSWPQSFSIRFLHHPWQYHG